MKKKIRQLIRQFHREWDGLWGRVLRHQLPLVKKSTQSGKEFGLESFSDFGYSKVTHFAQFQIMPIYATQVTSTCDLKVYQDLLIYSFIINNLTPGSRILEIGGGESRVIECLKRDYEFWNLDKLEGKGFGPKRLLNTDGFILVKDDIGNFSKKLPETYFDLIYSISAIEHFLKDEKSCERILSDMQRLLKPGGLSFHCIDALLFKDHLFVHPLVEKILTEVENAQSCLDFETINTDPDLWVLSDYAYYTRWYHLTKKTITTFGRPFSINIAWRRTLDKLTNN
jgi:SAM-dependent methyltransferase